MRLLNVIVVSAFLLTSASANAAFQGEFDPSHQDDPVAQNRVWRTNSKVEGAAVNASSLVSTKLGLSNDNGKSFIDLGFISRSFRMANGSAPGYLNASWRHETSSLVHDTAAAPAARWKVLWHRYLSGQKLLPNGQIENFKRHFEHGYISMKWASSPMLLAGSPELILLAGLAYNPYHPVIQTGGAGQPVSRLPYFALPDEMSDCLGLAEPGTLPATNGFYLSVLCFDTQENRRIELVKVEYGVQGMSLRYIGTLISDFDVQMFKAAYSSLVPEWADTEYLIAPDFTEINGRIFMTLNASKGVGGYIGCATLEIADIEQAQIARLGLAPKLIRHTTGIANSFRGACSYSKNSSGSGIVISQAMESAENYYQIHNSNVQLPFAYVGDVQAPVLYDPVFYPGFAGYKYMMVSATDVQMDRIEIYIDNKLVNSMVFPWWGFVYVAVPNSAGVTQKLQVIAYDSSENLALHCMGPGCP